MSHQSYQPSPTAADSGADQTPPAEQKAPVKYDPDAGLSREELINKYERKLIPLLKVSTLEHIKVIDSKWGVKPKGFEKVTAQRAKLSGLFPLPGYPRPVDFTKLEGVVKTRLNNEDDILNESSKIDPIDSRNSTILIIKNINFEKIDYLKITDYFNKFLNKVDSDNLSITNNIESKRKTKDDKNLIIEFTNNVAATIAYTLNGTKIFDKDFTITNHQQEDFEAEETLHNSNTITLDITRPGEYVAQCLPPYKEIKQDEIEEEVIDNPRKVSIILSDKTLQQTEIIDQLNKIAPIKGFQLLREVGTKESLGIAFVEFFVDPTKYSRTIKALSIIDKIIDKLNQEPYIEKAFYSCLINEDGFKTSIQDCPIDFNTLKALVKNEYVSTHPKLKVIQLLNIVTAKDLVDDANFNFIQSDILREVEKFGVIKSIKIPRPANDYTPGIVQFSQPGLGKVYIEFSDDDIALKAIMGLAGRLYNDRTVLCAFYNYEDFKNGLL